MDYYPVVITGAGPAGLTAAYALVKEGIQPIVLERADKVGGIARTEVYKGYRFDIGGHRFYTKVESVQQLWQEVLGDQFIQVPRLSRIYYQGKFFNYPLSLADTVSKLGVFPSAAILLSYLKAKLKARLRPGPEPDTFEQWAIDRFGRRLYRTFFKTYTEKVWGIPCNQIQADWAAQRIQELSLKRAVLNAIFGVNNSKSLIKQFDYPILGPGMMWERFQQLVNEQGGRVDLNTKVIEINHEENRITHITLEQDGEIRQIAGDHFVSSMPITALVKCMHPAPPEEIIQAANSLSYRAFIIVALIIDQPDLFPDNWIYIHSPEVKVGRIQNFKNWSPAMVPDSSKSCLGMEYFCDEGDEIWTMPNDELIRLATVEIERIGLAKAREVEDGTVIRQPKAYPVYDSTYRQHLEVIKTYLERFQNLQTVGRNGMHRYNNQDHSMLTGLMAAENLLGGNHDLWEVNTERSYYEEFTKADWKKTRSMPAISNSTQSAIASPH